VGLMRDEPQRQRRVRQVATQVRESLKSGGRQIPPGDSPIVPVIMGEEVVALGASQQLLEEGILVPAIRPPTVPRGSSRLRITLSCEHTDAEVQQLLAAIDRLRSQPDA